MSDPLEIARLQRGRPDWPVMRLKHLARLSGGGTPTKDNVEYWQGGEVPWVSPKDMKRRVITETEDRITEAAVHGSATSFVEAGSPLMVVRSGILRHTLPIAMAGVRLTLNQDMKAFALQKQLDARFFIYWIEGQSSDLLLEWRQFGATVESIDVGRMMNGRIALPDLETQTAIADFLDRETARIDQLIEKKEMLLRLLAERLDIKVKELLSKRHAEEMKLGHCLQLLFDGVHVTPTYVDDGVPFLRVTDITSSGPINWGRVKRISHDEFREITRRRSAKRGDLLLSKNGTVGVPKVVTWDDDFAFFVSLAVLRPSRRVTSEYLEVLFRSSLVREQISDQSRQTSVINLHLERIRNLKIPVPPLSEQESIVSRVKQLSQPIDALVARIQNSVVRLGEFRSALITAAVTGQIDMATWGKRSFTDRRLDQIEEAMRA